MNMHLILLNYLQSMPQSQSQTVVVENPMSVDSNGKLVIIIDLHFSSIWICIYLLHLTSSSVAFEHSKIYLQEFAMSQVSNVVVGVTIDKK